jgi:hypothetical protein
MIVWKDFCDVILVEGSTDDTAIVLVVLSFSVMGVARAKVCGVGL